MLGGLDRKVLLWTGAVLLAATLVAACARQRRRKKRARALTPPTQWRRVGCLEQVVIYPLKSGRGIETQQADCTERGLLAINDDEGLLRLRDRCFVVFNAKSGTYHTALQQPKMVLVSVTPEGEHRVRFSYPGDKPDLCIQLPGPDFIANPSYCSMWMKEKVPTTDCGDEAASWISEVLTGKPSGLRLGYSADGAPKRSLDNAPASVFKDFYNFRLEDFGVYSDMASYMLLGSSSVEDLNTRLPSHVKPATAGHFRPNLLVQGTPAYQEDDWDWVKIGDTVVFRNIKPCVRCHFTTIDPETGIMDLKYKEPLKTMKTYRQLTDPKAVELDGDSPVMGAYIGCYTPGTVHTGDPVYVGMSGE